MQIVLSLAFLVLSYVIGSIPFGLLIVRLKSGQDLRKVESGRTGGTNAMRAAGFWAGFLTAMLDVFKSAFAVWTARFLIAQNILPPIVWLEVLAPVLVVIGHNNSIFLRERDESGKLRLRGGAGGASAGGGALGLWAPSFLIVAPLGVLLLFVVGYASIATLSVGVVAALIFAVRAWLGHSPWEYVFYGILVEIPLIWALRPNIRRLLNGTERVVGLRARGTKQVNSEEPEAESDSS